MEEMQKIVGNNLCHVLYRDMPRVQGRTEAASPTGRVRYEIR